MIDENASLFIALRLAAERVEKCVSVLSIEESARLINEALYILTERSFKHVTEDKRRAVITAMHEMSEQELQSIRAAQGED